ncbi:MAG: divergent PAP2 family protein [Candidatus Woesearchaeota archaeon]|jgi:hypothetical protein
MNFTELFLSPIFWAIVVSLFIAQCAKVLLLVFRQKQKLVWDDLVVTGNMPSTHSAVVLALTVIIMLTEGFTSTFFVSLVFTFIVLRDAVGVRRTVGEESKVLTNVITALKTQFHINISRKMHQSLGHQPLEVFVGSLIGIISSISVYIYFTYFIFF